MLVPHGISLQKYHVLFDLAVIDLLSVVHRNITVTLRKFYLCWGDYFDTFSTFGLDEHVRRWRGLRGPLVLQVLRPPDLIYLIPLS
jgi:hypothetical protein